MNEPGTFDKALLLAKQLADHEIASVNRSYERLTSTVKCLGGIALALLTFLGLGTYKGIQLQVKEMVREQMPDIVQQQIANQLDRRNIQATVEKAISIEVKTDIEKIVDTRVEDVVSSEVRKQQPLIEVAVQKRTDLIMNALRPEINRQVSATAIQIVSAQLAPRVLSEKQMSLIKDHLQPSSSAPVVVRSDYDPERIQFANQISKALKKGVAECKRRIHKHRDKCRGRI